MTAQPSKAERPATYEDANLLLRLYELRREEKLRKAREWFSKNFHVSNLEELQKLCPPGSEENAYVRMVQTYWDMAASFVAQGAIDAQMFNAANTEHFALYAKMRPFLSEIRAATNYPDYLMNVERVVTSLSDAEDRVAIFSRYMERQRKFAAEGKQRAYLA